MKRMRGPSIMLILSMTIFGTIGLFVRSIPIPSGELALYRAILAVLVIGLYLLITREKINLKSIKKELPLLILSGAFIGINWILLFEAYRYTTVSVATLSYYFAPVLVMAVCPILFKEKMTKKQIICFIMSTLGLVLITGVSGGGGNDLVGILFGIGAAVFYAAVIILNKYIKGVDAVHRTILQFSATIITLIPYVLLTGGVTVMSLSGIGWINLIVIGVIHTGFTYCMYFASLKELPGQKAAIMGYIDPLVAVLISVTLLEESMSVWQIIGGALILGFTIFNEIGNKSEDT